MIKFGKILEFPTRYIYIKMMYLFFNAEVNKEITWDVDMVDVPLDRVEGLLLQLEDPVVVQVQPTQRIRILTFIGLNKKEIAYFPAAIL